MRKALGWFAAAVVVGLVMYHGPTVAMLVQMWSDTWHAVWG